jgi:hypothetical protein
MFEEAKPVGVPQLPVAPPLVPVVVNDARALNELVPPAEQTVWTWNWYAVPAESPVKLTGVIVIPLTVVHVEEDDAFHWRL